MDRIFTTSTNAMDIRNFTDKDLFTFVGLEVQQAGPGPAKRDKVNFFCPLWPCLGALMGQAAAALAT